MDDNRIRNNLKLSYFCSPVILAHSTSMDTQKSIHLTDTDMLESSVLSEAERRTVTGWTL